MNDNYIIKALECCAVEHNCNGCFCNVPESAYSAQCIDKIMHASLDLINRQKAEIERQQKYNTNVAFKHYNDAIKEFAERLKSCTTKFTEYDEGGWDSTIYAVKVEDIQRIVKEMTEGGE